MSIDAKTAGEAGGAVPAIQTIQTIQSVTAIVVDDEPLARARLRRLLEQQAGVTVVAEAMDAVRALTVIEEKQPDLALLDIQMPGLTGLQLASALLQLPRPPMIAFVTGYSEHAVAAFDQGVLDYLVKPVSAERIARTVERVRQRIAENDQRSLTAQREAAMQRIAEDSREDGELLRRVPIKANYAVRLLRLDEVVSFDARDKGVFVSTLEGEAGRTYYTLTQLEKLLPADAFLRIHDSHTVNLDRVLELSFLGNHSYAVRLPNDRMVPVGKTRYANLRRALGL